MNSNLDRYRKDIDSLIKQGNRLYLALYSQCDPEDLRKTFLTKYRDETKAKAEIGALPSFALAYQSWYSTAKALIRQVLPDRLDDFTRHYEVQKGRKEITRESYKIEDCLQGISVTRTQGIHETKIVGREAALPRITQQLAIIESAKERFESSLFDIRQLVQADIFDSELDAAEELARNKFARAAGAVAGVVLERHLGQVCESREIKIAKKNPGISDFNEALKKNDVIDIPQWRLIQFLGDIRNLCDHSKEAEPTKEQIDDLISGVKKATKTIY